MDAQHHEQFDRKLRQVMRNGDIAEMKEHREVFYITGTSVWTVRAPYWHVALATDANGNRFLSDDDLDRVLPKWRLILEGKNITNRRYPMAAKYFRVWLDSERQKARRLGKPWPQLSPALPSPMPGPKTPASGEISSTFVFPLQASGYASASPFDLDESPEAEETRLLKELLRDVRDINKLVAGAIQRNTVQPMTSAPQHAHAAMVSVEQVYGPPFQGHYGAPQWAFYPEAQGHTTEIQPHSETSGADGSAMPELMKQYRTQPLQHLTPASVYEEERQQWLDAQENI